MQINILEAKNRLSQLVKSAQAGEDVVIANRGEPVARLIAVGRDAAAASAPPAEGVLAWLARHPLPAYARRPAAAIDAALVEERAAWD